MVNSRDILETINMIDNEHLDVRTITMGISLLDCIDSNIQTACTKVYDKICRYAKDLVKTGEDISKEYGIPIINKKNCGFSDCYAGRCVQWKKPQFILRMLWIKLQKKSALTLSADIPLWYIKASVQAIMH